MPSGSCGQSKSATTEATEKNGGHCFFEDPCAPGSSSVSSVVELSNGLGQPYLGRSYRRLPSRLSVVAELEGDAEVVLAELAHGVLQVVFRRRALPRLIEGVVDFLEVNRGGDIERRSRCHADIVVLAPFSQA